MTKVLYIPSGTIIKFAAKPAKDEKPHMFKDKDFSTVTLEWEESDAGWYEKYDSIETYLKFACSPGATHSFEAFKTFNELPNEIEPYLFEILK